MTSLYFPERLGDSGAKTGLNLPSVGARLFSVTPPVEQNAITACLDRRGRQIEIETSHLEKLRVLKAGLMQDLLAGKVRVKVDKAEEVGADA